MQRLVLFDLDGTLLDSADIIVSSQERAFTAVGLAVPTRERALSIVGLSLPEAFTVLVGRDGPVEALCEAYKQAFAAFRADGQDRERLFPGVPELLDFTRTLPDTLMGIATGKSRRGVDAVKRSYGWDGLFQVEQTSDDAPSKPHPAMVLNAGAACGISPDRIVMIGDSAFDMAMAKAAGAFALGVSWGFQDIATLKAAGADVIVDDMAGLRQVLAG